MLLLGCELAGCGGNDGAVPAGASANPDADAPVESGGSGGVEGGTPVVDLRADVNRDGNVDLADPADDVDEESWDASHGAVFLANLDDDENACSKASALSDDEIALCNDAADTVVNGPEDMLDLARMKIAPWPDAPEDASGRIEVSSAAADRVRVFVQRAGVFEPLSQNGSLSVAEIREGVELAIEGRDIVRDPAVWDGFVDVTLHVSANAGAVSGGDTVRLRVAPVVLSHHLQPVETLYATNSPGDPDGLDFLADLDAAAKAAAVPNGLVRLTVPEGDQRTQDLFESGVMTMPEALGQQRAIRVFMRSASLGTGRGPRPLRAGSRIVYTAFRGKDAAAIQQYDINHDLEMDSLDSFGNTETIPPYTHGGESYPLGRIFRGSVPSFHPDATMSLLLASQGVQPVLTVNTEWLWVGHVDETLSFIRANSPLGFAVIANDPSLAREMLEAASAQGFGETKMFVGQRWLDDTGTESPEEITIDQVLADTGVMAKTAEAAVEVEAQLDVLRQAIGLAEEDNLRVPYLHDSVYGYAIAYQPGTVNGVVLADKHVAAPDPDGPEVQGEDIFKKQMTDTFGTRGMVVHVVEDWNLYHRLEGEVHCGSNAVRVIPTDVRWWETVR